MTKTLRRRIIAHWQIYLFLALPLAYLILFCYVPMVGVQLGFRNYTIRDGMWGSKWVGLAQFTKFFGSYQSKRVVTNTLSISVYSIFASFPIPILFALMLNSITQERYKRFMQTVTYMPHFISVIVLVGMILQMANPRVGLYGQLMHSLTGQYPADPFGNPAVFPHLYVWSGIWQQFGWNSIIYLAALSAVNPELHEAATIDGASRLQRVRYIDLPSILPTATIMLILRMGSVMSVGFEKAYLMQNPLNLSTSELISTYTYKVGMGIDSLPNYSYSTAIGLFNSVINLVLICTVNALAGKMSDTSLW